MQKTYFTVNGSKLIMSNLSAVFLEHPVEEIYAYLSAKLVHFWRFAIVQPSIVKHKPHIINKLPRIVVQSFIKLRLHQWQVHRILYDTEIILQTDPNTQHVKNQWSQQHIQWAHSVLTGNNYICLLDIIMSALSCRSCIQQWTLRKMETLETKGWSLIQILSM